MKRYRELQRRRTLQLGLGYMYAYTHNSRFSTHVLVLIAAVLRKLTCHFHKKCERFNCFGLHYAHSIYSDEAEDRARPHMHHRQENRVLEFRDAEQKLVQHKSPCLLSETKSQAPVFLECHR